MMLSFNRRVAVSGGCDSMALCVLFQHVKEKICVFTVNHELRKESKKEADEVHRIVSNMGFYHKILSVKWPENQIPTKSIESKARDLRYTLLTRACLENDIRALFLGHHSDDQAETVFMRFIERSGPDGLAGMQKIAQNPMTGRIMHAENVFLCRPFLYIPKMILKSICKNHNVPWFEDPTNSLVSLSKRNAIRKLFQNPEQLPDVLKPLNMLNIAQVMNKKRIKVIENVKRVFSKAHITTGSLEIVCGKNILEEKMRTLLKLMTHLISMVSPLKKQRITSVWRITVDLFTKNFLKTRQYTVGGVLIYAEWHFETLFIRLARQPYAKSVKENPTVLVQSTSFSNPQDTWVLWDGRWWIRILSKNDIIKQFRVRHLAENDIKPLFRVINSVDICYRKTMLRSLKAIKGNTKFTIPLVEFENDIIGLPTLGIIFDHNVTIEVKFKVDILFQFNYIT
ncbi:hypothetical protein PORY_002835 [Pneumocystis oryctolagi]|uniref:Uncharacterized protein n=1 Tax=Pneumocystis oryctolagi TaxID=42067 RepID=A0ACB7C825_9ASCO|nr:hypothetical protein PORY_002835 [Pneumocystis oryctolagi]